MKINEPLQLAIDELSKLPTIGKKTAQRLAMYILKTDSAEVEKLVKAISELKTKIRFCSVCYNISVGEVCDICSSTRRDRSILCVVEEINDVIAIERTNEFNGLYHVLGGVLNPLNGTGADSLKIKELLVRLEKDRFTEIILALNPDTEGETTALYLAKLLKPSGVKVTRIARGLPVGGDFEFADEATIGRAVVARIVI